MERVCINDVLTEDGLREVLARLNSEEERDSFGLVCKRWLRLQSSERRRLCARAGPAMLRRMADRFPGVLELDLSQSASRSFYPGVSDSDLAVIVSGFRSLRVLVLQNCKGISDAGIITLGNGLPSLQSLDVSYCRKLTDNGLTSVALGCCNLKSLYLVGLKSVTDRLLQTLSSSCFHLEELSLSGCTNVTDTGLSILVNGCRHIKSLDISKCNKIGDLGVSVVALLCSLNLKTLKLMDCYAIGDRSIFYLAKSCSNLETLVIGGCISITNESIKSLALSCGQSLRNLRMDWCVKVTDESLSYVFEHCRHLVALDIGNCDNVTDLAFKGLGKGGLKSDLKVLKVGNCQRITVLGIETVLQFCGSLEYLDLRSCPHATRIACDQAGLRFPKHCKVNYDGSLSDTDAIINMFF